MHPLHSPIRRALLTGLLALAAPAAMAQTTTRLVVGYPPGGSNDVVARILAPRLATELGVNVVVENRAGANGTVGAGSVAKADPDGQTLLVVSSSPLVIVPHVMKLPYDTLQHFAPVGQVGFTPEAVGVSPRLGLSSLGQLLDRAKTQDVRFSSSGNGGLPHLTIELLKAATKSRIVHVPYKGGGPAVTDAIAGHVEAVVMDLSALMPHFKAGTLRPLAVTTAQRDEFLPDVPTAAELGWPSVNAANWIGLFAPAKTPADVVARLHAALGRVLAQPEVAQQLRAAALAPVSSPSPAAFTQFVAREHARWGQVVRDAKVTNE